MRFQADPGAGRHAPSLPGFLVQEVVRRALAEDLVHAGDITTRAVVAASARARCEIVAKTEGILAGAQPAALTFELLGPDLGVRFHEADGAQVKAGDVVAVLEGAAQPILAAERTALNFLGHLSGVATATHRLVRAVEGTGAKITGTRKTTPGLRGLEKDAVRAGGGVNHRLSLDGAILIKDNHVAASGGVRRALLAARASRGPLTSIEIEVDTLDQLDEALAVGAEAILLDNMRPPELREAVRRAGGRARLEASGGITLESVREVAEAGVDFISSGWITHSAPALDFGLELRVQSPGPGRAG